MSSISVPSGFIQDPWMSETGRVALITRYDWQSFTGPYQSCIKLWRSRCLALRSHAWKHAHWCFSGFEETSTEKTYTKTLGYVETRKYLLVQCLPSFFLRSDHPLRKTRTLRVLLAPGCGKKKKTDVLDWDRLLSIRLDDVRIQPEGWQGPLWVDGCNARWMTFSPA